jgi:hypothetical protein
MGRRGDAQGVSRHSLSSRGERSNPWSSGAGVDRLALCLFGTHLPLLPRPLDGAEHLPS